jgi:pyrimidine operon attenuation protein/uracil phosphoribosyltransferase
MLAKMGNRQSILDVNDIDRILRRISHSILEEHRGAEDLALIGIHTRGVYLAKRIQGLLQHFEGISTPAGEIDITLYRDDWTRIGQYPVVQATHIPFSLEGRKIILVDDVLYTGRTTRAALNALVDFGRPDRVELAVLVDRGHRELPIQANYIGKHVETRRSETISVHLNECDGDDMVILEEKPEENR